MGDRLQLTSAPIARAEMLVRRSVAEVFAAFVDPDITARFWFTKGSRKPEVGTQVQWEWEMYDISIPVTVKALETNQRILIEWPGENGATTVKWLFTPRKDGTTFVSITNSGFSGGADAAVKQAIDATEGFAFVLAGLKALLEHNVRLNLVPDRFPAGLAQ